MGCARAGAPRSEPGHPHSSVLGFKRVPQILIRQRSMVTTSTVTAEELLAMGSDAPFELIQGELVRVSPSAGKSNYVLGNVHSVIRDFVRPRTLGNVSVGEAGYRLETDPDSVVSPDVGYVVRNRMPIPIPDRGYIPLRPDLAVEVISPTDERGDIERKQARYARVGVLLVWGIDPSRETATVHAVGASARMIDRTGVLDGGDILPGFQVLLAELFDEL